MVRALTNALTENRLHHAYLFTGTRGVGKTTLARILAKALNCVGPDGNGRITATPCNVCEPCTAIDAGRFVDYIEMDAASNRGVDEMVQLLERAMYAPSNARFKVYMIDEVHQLSSHAFNAMLKTLEEPPQYVKFILATTDPQKVPVTVLSRCLQFNLKQMTPLAIAEHMAGILSTEKSSAEPPAFVRWRMRRAAACATACRCSIRRSPMREAVSRSTQCARCWERSIRHVDQVLDAIAARDAAKALAIADQMNERSVSFAQAMRDLASLLHRLALIQQVASAADDEVDAEIYGGCIHFRGRRDSAVLSNCIAWAQRMHLAPDEYAGFTMALMRMLAFAPIGSASRRRACGGVCSGAASARREPASVLRETLTSKLLRRLKRQPLCNLKTQRASFDGDWMVSSRD